MTGCGVDAAVRQAIGGDTAAISWIVTHADTSDDALVITMAALLERQPDRLRRAETVAATTRDRQVVAIARAHLAGDSELVDALARDHLTSFPGTLVVAWIASEALDRPGPTGRLRSRASSHSCSEERAQTDSR
jgi:hypothetical protein